MGLAWLLTAVLLRSRFNPRQRKRAGPKFDGLLEELRGDVPGGVATGRLSGGLMRLRWLGVWF